MSDETTEQRKRTTFSAGIRDAVWKKTGGLCWYCSKRLTPGDFHIDHVQAFSLGGEDHIANLVPSCRRCNLAKSAINVQEFDAPINSDEPDLEVGATVIVDMTAGTRAGTILGWHSLRYARVAFRDGHQLVVHVTRVRRAS